MKILTKDTYNNWNTIPPVPAGKIKNVNCHKFVLFVIGKISFEEMILNPNLQPEMDFTFGDVSKDISDKPFLSVKNLDSLHRMVDQDCSVGESYVGQILDSKTEEMAHSFIVKREDNNKYTCFNKPGFKYNFEVCKLEDILNFVNKDGEKSNQDQEWRFVSVNNIK